MKTTKESVQRQSAKNNTAPTPQYTATMTPPNYGVSVADAPFIQAKLMVGSPHDPLEQEADRAADRFVNNLQSVGNAKPTVANTPIVQMKAAQTSFGGVEASPQVAQQIEAALDLLDPSLRRNLGELSGQQEVAGIPTSDTHNLATQAEFLHVLEQDHVHQILTPLSSRRRAGARPREPA